jgi:hypothetical protein
VPPSAARCILTIRDVGVAVGLQAQANFGELRNGEIRRIPLPRTPVNKAKKEEGPGTISWALSKKVGYSLYDPLVTDQTKGDALMFDSLTSKVVTAICAVVGAIALLGTFFLTVTGGSPYLQFGLALIFFAMFIVGSYWWMVFGTGRGL